MRRPPSYSDSFLVLPGTPGASLEPLVIPGSEETLPPPAEEAAWPRRVTIFLFKGATHVLFISAFETAFYFLYVNKSEDAGILGTINTYYQPLVRGCSVWSNTTKWVLQEFLKEVDAAAIDATGAAAEAARLTYNHGLLIWSSMYSVICLAVCLGAVGVVKWQRWSVPWGRILTENLLFVAILGAYEAFFFRTIIYNYDTLSTPELNRYIVDGLEQCASMRV